MVSFIKIETKITKRTCTTLLVFLSATVFLFAQKKNDLATAGSIVFETNEKYAGNKIPFSEIIVKDFRFDSSKLGYINNNVKKIVFNKQSSAGFTSALGKYFSDILDPSAQRVLVIVVKSFWLQRGYYDMVNDNTIKSSELAGDDDQSGLCLADLEIFSMVSGNYKALLKLDYEFELGKYKKKKLDVSFFVPFDSLARKIASLDVNKILSTKRNFTLSELETNYTKRFDLPILKSSSTRGVFLNFEDFKNNKPAYPGFIIRAGKLTDEIYTEGDDLLTKFWGFFDGKDYYIRIGHNFYKMIRQNNTFDLLGPPRTSQQYSTSPGYSGDPYSIPYTTTYIKSEPRPLQLDMENGEVY